MTSSGASAIIIVIYLLLVLAGLWLSYAIIRAAVRAALADHYRTVRRYEATGEWLGAGRAPKTLPDSDRRS
ncbi:hypothetical protein [Leifsonia sp. Leaf264]|uniref:hypothetical protein n=1 Tax=Leifsonia sp. Leaf264 TaxID=1736314 RepID=UPI0006FF3F35|nr:hypothetical protein [Leifsonia sp. Leaf264]KQP01861.1 hypothetical protein ASF30_04690 [Leifsonia sp. Leaf264]